MAEWEGDAPYFWGNEMNNHEGDWDFDALNEIDWTVWDELAPPAAAPPHVANNDIPPPPPPAPPTASHQRNISSSSHTLSASIPPSPDWPNSPPMRGPQSPPPHSGIRLGTPYRIVEGVREHYHGPTRPSLQRHLSHAVVRVTRPTHTPAYENPANRARYRRLSVVTSSSEGSTEEEEQEEDASFLLYPEIFDATSSSSSSDEEREDGMAPTAHRRRANNNEARARGAVVDLTLESSPPPEGSNTTTRSRPPKRPAPNDSKTNPPPNKRNKPTPSSSDTPSQQPIEAFDLTNETTTAEEEVLRAQQAAAISAQQSSDGPLPIGKRTCIICLEPFTDVTITHCGHIYCHECLTQALAAGEKNSERGVGTCPVCRKPVRRGKANQMVVVSFMKRETWGKGKSSSFLLGS